MCSIPNKLGKVISLGWFAAHIMKGGKLKMGNSGYVPNNTNIKKSTGTPNLFFDSRDNVLFRRNDKILLMK
jgi:hypothetical protein